jgi:hypothetical protein
MVVTLLLVLVALVAYAIWVLMQHDAQVLDRLKLIMAADAREHAKLLAALQAAPTAPTPGTHVVERIDVDPLCAHRVAHARQVAGELDALLVAARDRQAATPAPPPVVAPPKAREIGVLSPGQKLIRARLALRQKKGKK